MSELEAPLPGCSTGTECSSCGHSTGCVRRAVHALGSSLLPHPCIPGPLIWLSPHHPPALPPRYPDDAPAERLFTISRPRRQERRPDAPRRSVQQCYVFAGEGVEVSGLLEGLVAQARAAHGSLAGPITVTAAAVSAPDGGPPSTLILRAFQEQQAAVLLDSPAGGERLQRCDVAAFVFDGQQPDSFRAAVRQMVAVATAAGDVLPCLLIAANDEDMGTGLAAEVGEACSALAVKPPCPLGAKPGAGLYQAIIQTALSPELAIPETPSLKATRHYRRMLRRALFFTGAGTVAVLAGYLAWRVSRAHTSSSATAAEQPPSSSGGSSSVQRAAVPQPAPGLAATQPPPPQAQSPPPS